MLMMFIPFAIIPMLVMVLSYFLIFNAVSARQSVVCPTYTNNNQLKAELRKWVQFLPLLLCFDKSRFPCTRRWDFWLKTYSWFKILLYSISGFLKRIFLFVQGIQRQLEDCKDGTNHDFLFCHNLVAELHPLPCFHVQAGGYRGKTNIATCASCCFGIINQKIKWSARANHDMFDKINGFW